MSELKNEKFYIEENDTTAYKYFYEDGDVAIIYAPYIPKKFKGLAK